MKDSCNYSFKAILLYSTSSELLGEKSVIPRNKKSYENSRRFLQNQVKENIEFFFNKRRVVLKEYDKEFSDGNMGSEFLIENGNIVYKISQDSQGNLFADTKEGDRAFQDFSNDREFFLKSDTDNNYEERFELIFIDYSKRFHFYIESIYLFLNKVVKRFSPEYSKARINDYYDTYLSQKGSWYKKWFNKGELNDEEYPFDLKYIKRLDVNVLIYKFLEYFQLPQLEPIQMEHSVYPEEKFLYEGSNLWLSPTPNGINSFRSEADGKKISEEVTIFPSIESWYSWEYWGIKNRKRCRLCNRLLPKGYKGKYCSKEYDPECRKRYERLKKRGTLP